MSSTQQSRAAARERLLSGLELSLREHLLTRGGAATGAAPSPYPPSATSANPYPNAESGSPNHNIDPNVSGDGLPYPGGDAMDEDMSSSQQKGKRELSTSKRAAQNRAAQRAFRQRKETYIRKLEKNVDEYKVMEASFKALQDENYQLREYILNLQARLLDNQTEFPPAPSNINLSAGMPAAPSSNSAEQQLRREMQQQQQQQQQQHQPPAPAPVVAREDASRLDGLSQLQAAAAVSSGETQPHAASDAAPSYPPAAARQRAEEARLSDADAKPAAA